MEISSSTNFSESVSLLIDFVNSDFNISNLSMSSVNMNDGNGFMFVGSCHAVCSNTNYECIHVDSCAVQSNLITIKFPYLVAG